MNCEVTAQTCQPPFETITVTPKDSKVTLKCSIKTGGNVQDLTWQGVEETSGPVKVYTYYKTIRRMYISHVDVFLIKYASEHFLLFPLL